MIPIENARVLVTGGAGFIGANLVRRLIREGARVTVLDDLFTGRLENLPRKGYEFVKGSVCDPPIVEKLVAAADASGAWYDRFPEHMNLSPRDFAWSYIQRSGRIDPERLAKISPKFART